MRDQTHPDMELLDRLRAGLLDEDAEESSRLERHIGTCPQCRGYLEGWKQLGPMALGPELDPAAVSKQLHQLRQQALASAKRPHSRNYQLLATAALLLIAVTVGIWTVQYQESDAPQMTAQGGDTVPDLYEELDFYLWLADQNGDDTNSDNEDANST
jgi:anti-sigma factor RsiW